MWLTGESYAGIYIPNLLYQIDQYNANATTPINVKGMMVGNGVTNWTYDTLQASIYTSHNHMLISDELFDSMMENSCDYSGLNFGRFPSDLCLDLYNTFLNLTALIDPYNIFQPVQGVTPAL